MSLKAAIKYGELGYGHVVIPTDMERDKYISMCYDLGSCSIFVEDIGVITDVKVGLSIINLIKFPEVPTTFGSTVAFFRTPRYNNYVIFEVINNSRNTSPIREYSFFHGKTYKNNSASIIGDAKSGSISVIVKGGDGKLSISLDNSNKTASLDAKVNGSIDLESKSHNIVAYDSINILIPGKTNETNTEIKYTRGSGLTYTDEFKNELLIKDGEIKFKGKKISLYSDKEPAVLGKTLSDLLEELITAISNITVTTAIGVQPIINKAQFLQIKQKVNTIVSKIVNLE